MIALVVVGANFFGTQGAKANTLTLQCGTVAGNPATGATTVSVNTDIYCDATTSLAATTVQWTTTATGGAFAGSPSGDTTLTTIGTAPSTNFTFFAGQSTGASGTIVVNVAFTDANGLHPASQNGSATITMNAATGAVSPAVNATGTAGTAVFQLPIGVQCTSDVTVPGATLRTCTAADVSFATTGTATGTVTGVTATGLNNATGTVTVTFTDAGVGTVTPQLSVYNNITGSPANSFLVATATAKSVVVPELRHIADDGTVIALKDIVNNVRGSAHTVCLVSDNDAGTGLVADTGLLVPQLTVNSFVVTNSGGYAGPLLSIVGPQTPTFTDPQLFTGTGANGGLAGATCLSYISTGAGDQQISAEYVAGGTTVTIDWDTDDDGNGLGASPLNDSLVKEWNVLEASTLTGAGTGVFSNTGRDSVFNTTIPLTLNPAMGIFGFTSAVFTDIFVGQHQAANNVTQGPFALAGVDFTVALTGCGKITVNGVPGPSVSGTTVLLTNGTVGYLIGAGPAVATLSVAFSQGGSNCGASSSAQIVFTGREPGNLGSGTGIVVTETVNLFFSVVIPTKQVFLAWAGQRVILEHDWRLPPGDVDGGSTSSSVAPLGVCAVGPRFDVTYLKGSGPGNFLPALGTFENPVFINGNDEAVVVVNGDDAGDNSQTDGDDVIAEPNDSCISRVLYESEDPGEVDIEAFISAIPSFRGLLGDQAGQREAQISGFGASKVAFVVYYMKLNTVNVSLVDDVSKPRHNATGTDYSPGNPWDASKDVTTVDWNVSKDLLVRGRVTGWFINTNPSGRAEDKTDPLNVLPANRWVMPNDWALLAGGPADNADNSAASGTAEAFRPQYDIMINPGRGNRGLDTPESTFLASAAVLGAELTATGTTVTIKLPQSGTIVNGAHIRIDNEDMDVTTVLTPNATGTLATFSVNRGQYSTAPAVHAVNAIVLVVSGISTPFEGPYSLLDLPALGASAALSDWDPNNVRDTIWKDGDVDWWDAPMPPALVTVDIRGTGFIKQVLKQDVYYNGTANSTLGQTYPNPFYISNIPDSPFIPAVVAGGGFYWDSWGSDGPGGNGQGVYRFWQPIPTLISATTAGQNPVGIADSTVTALQLVELNAIRAAYGTAPATPLTNVPDGTIARTLVVYSDNHGEFMVTANGDFKTVLTACSVNSLAGGFHCKPGDKVGTGSIYATVDYPDFRGKHFPVKSNTATVTWTWGGYKDVTVETGGVDQFKYIVFHALDRDGFCSAASFGAISLHPVLSGAANDAFNGRPKETVDFLIDSGEGIIVGTSGGATTGVNDGKQFATGVLTFSTLVNTANGSPILAFKNSPLASATQADECQAWIKVSNSLLGVLNALVIAHNDEGNVGFDKIVDLTNTTSYTLNFRWSLVTWAGADGISINDAIKGTGTTGKNPGGNDISASVTAIYGWDQAAQQWLGFFPTGVNVPGANDLTSLKTGQAFWIAITGPGSVTWTVASNVN